MASGFKSEEIDNGSNVLVRFDSIELERPAATLFVIGVEQVWIPVSQIAEIDAKKKEMWIPLWLAEKKGLEYE